MAISREIVSGEPGTFNAAWRNGMNGNPTEHVTVASNLERAIVPRVCKREQVTALLDRGGKR